MLWGSRRILGWYGEWESVVQAWGSCVPRVKRGKGGAEGCCDAAGGA